MANVCIDASIVVKWVLVESDTAAAAALLVRLANAGDRVIAPLHLPAEVTSAVYKRLRAKVISSDEARAALAEFAALPLRLRHPTRTAQRALTIAAQLNLKYPYDAFYLALGELLDCDVWTADRALYGSARSSFPRLRLLGEFEAEAR